MAMESIFHILSIVVMHGLVGIFQALIRLYYKQISKSLIDYQTKEKILNKVPLMASSSSKQHSVIVLMVPFLAQSHLNQLLQLSHVVSSSYDIPVHYISSSLHNSQVKSRSPTPNLARKIHFHDFPTPHFLSPQPTKTPNNFPNHLIPSFQASIQLRKPFSELLTKLKTTAERVVVIHDLMMSYVVQDSIFIAPNSEVYVFHCVSAISRVAFIRDAIGESSFEPKIPSPDGTLDPSFEAFIEKQVPFMKANKSGHLYNSCRVVESDFLDFISEKEVGNYDDDDDMKIWAIGPLDTVTVFFNINGDSSLEKVYYLDWLDKQRPNSVLYISFGTTTFLETKQIEEIAIGLEKSGVNFIWVLRDADKGDIFNEEEGIRGRRSDQLPKGFEERVKGMGMVVREWVSQLEILGHPSTGGFMSHCGWNSCFESMSLGVPLLAWPMHSDQPMNAALVTEFVKVGLGVGELGGNDGLVSCCVIENVVKRLMCSDEGDEIRKRAEKLGVELRKATAEGGVSRMELDSFISHITR
ncbi:hypothetical protein G4B88_029535 [Cannabis sativa]|uniref:Glycosyltransferase n=1 Tax=Cannabis sativa TaxID=3483 RepID=A0A7J6E8Q4_CANSA|nr:hypothetical protein G4B88_029535 [Cannabis sativa]